MIFIRTTNQHLKTALTKVKTRFTLSNKHQIKNAQRLAVGFLLITSLFTIVAPLASASHGGTVDFIAAVLNYDVGTLITVFDPTAAGAGTVTVTVTSDSDPTGITLTLTENPLSLGTFDNLDPSTGSGTLLFMDGDNKFPLETTRTISFNDLTSPDPSNQTQIIAVVTSGGFAVILDLPETGPDSNTYEGSVKFTASPSGLTDIPITAGETFSILFPCEGASNGQITPIPAGSTLGVLRADVGNTITVTYVDPASATFTDTATLGSSSGCGGGGGGLIVIPVIQALLGFAGGGGHDKTPPSLTRPISSGVQFDPFEPIAPTEQSSLVGAQRAPLIIDGNHYNLHGFSNTIYKNTVKTGQFTDMSLAFEEASKVSHVAMYFVDQGKDENSDRDPALIFDNGNVIKVDPEGIFGDDIQLSTSKEGTKSIFNFGASFDKPTKKNLIIVAWDDKRNSQKTKIFNALEVVGNPIPDQVAHFLPIEEHGEFDLVINDDGQYVLSQLVETKTVTQNSPKTIVYPKFIGRSERHDDGFKQELAQEDIKAQTIALEMIGSTFTPQKDKPEHIKFFYPSNVGKLDREKENTLKDVMLKEHTKATKIWIKLYHTNHWED